MRKNAQCREKTDKKVRDDYFTMTFFSILRKLNKIKKPPPKREPFLCGYMLFKRSVGSLNLTGTQTSCADVYSARSAVNDSLNLLYIGLKASVRASV